MTSSVERNICLLAAAYDDWEFEDVEKLFADKKVKETAAKILGEEILGFNFFGFAGNIAVSVRTLRKLSPEEQVKVEEAIRGAGIQTTLGAIHRASS